MPQLDWDDLVGVVRTTVGYTGGDGDGDADAQPPTYERVCSLNNTHTEALRVEFDPSIVTYEQLVRRFTVDPRVQRVRPRVEGEEGDESSRFRRRQTRIAIWSQNGAQAATAARVLAEAGKEELVPILPRSAWHEAEEHHQHFLAEDKAFPSWSAPLDGDEEDDDWGDLGGPGTAWGL